MTIAEARALAQSDPVPVLTARRGEATALARQRVADLTASLRDSRQDHTRPRRPRHDSRRRPRPRRQRRTCGMDDNRGASGPPRPRLRAAEGVMTLALLLSAAISFLIVLAVIQAVT